MSEPMISPGLQRVRIGDSPIAQLPIGFGGSWFMPYGSASAADADFIGAMDAAFDSGVRHFDTGAGYGNGHSEDLYGRFLKTRRDEVFIASKYDPPEGTAAAMYDMIGQSLKRLGVDKIDLYYIHWPRIGRDLRPVMEGLQRARDEGKVGAVGVSNFSVADMAQVGEVARQTPGLRASQWRQVCSRNDRSCRRIGYRIPDPVCFFYRELEQAAGGSRRAHVFARRYPAQRNRHAE